MSSSKLGWLMIVAGLAAGGCVVGSPEALESTETSERTQELGSIIIPPNLPTLCYSSPGCSLTYLGGYVTTLQQALGCSQTYRYWSNATAGFMGGRASYCADTTTNRSLLRSSGYRIYEPGYCNDCLDIPETKMFVFWEEWWGPGCPSSCAPGNSPHAP